MHIRTGFAISFDTFGPTPMNLLLNVHADRRNDLITPEAITFDPPVPMHQHVDAFGNVCTRIVAPGGRITMAADFTVADSGAPDVIEPEARQIPVQDLPDAVLMFLLGSRYCDTDKLS
ncbi:transglutaminase family protein, partial [Methylobacterium sp. E-005]|nr:transglutaminase family protein [Methylobacterium sp. E-005]